LVLKPAEGKKNAPSPYKGRRKQKSTVNKYILKGHESFLFLHNTNPIPSSVNSITQSQHPYYLILLHSTTPASYQNIKELN